MRRRWGAILAGSLALVVSLAIVLTDSKPRQSGSNYVAEAGPVAEIRGSGERCQRRAAIPADTDAVRILLGTYGRPAPAVEVSARVHGQEITRGALARGGPEGHVVVPLRRVEHTTPGARVCVRVRGGERTVLYGSERKVRLEWQRPGSESWLELAPTVARRFGFGKANAFGSWLLLVAGLLLAVAWALAGRVVARELAR